MKNISWHFTLSLERRENIAENIGRIIFETASSVASSPTRPRERNASARSLSTTESNAFLRWHSTRVSCVFIRSVGLPRNENGVPGGVRRELVFLTHFSRRRTPENRLSPRGPAERRAQCYTFAILASHPFQSSLDVKSTLRVVVASPFACENEGE